MQTSSQSKRQEQVHVAEVGRTPAVLQIRDVHIKLGGCELLPYSLLYCMPLEDKDDTPHTDT